MRGRHAAVTVGLAILVATLTAAGAAGQGRVRETLRAVSCFPLQAGLYWVYERQGAGGTSTWRVEVVADPAPTAGSVTLGLSGYFPGPTRKVRVWPLDVVTEVRPEGGRDALWYMLRAPEGLAWTLDLAAYVRPGAGGECIDGARLHVAGRREVVEVPAGEFKEVVRLDFRPSCADAGITSEWFAPGVGLIRREETSLAGPVISELVESNAGGGWPVRLPYTTAISLDRPVVVNNLMPPVDPEKLPVLNGLLTVRNDSGMPLDLELPRCLGALVEVRDAAGVLVLTGHADEGVRCRGELGDPVRLGTKAIALRFSLRLMNERGAPLPDGRYAVTAILETLDPPPLRPQATARIEVKSVH